MSSLYSELENLYDQDVLINQEQVSILEWLIKHREDINNIEIDYLSYFQDAQEKIADLEHRLSNCIEPKFKIGQEVWFVKYFNAGCYEFAYGKVIEIKITEYDGIFYEMEYRNNCEIDFKSRHEKYVFATEEEAKAKLREMQDGN